MSVAELGLTSAAGLEQLLTLGGFWWRDISSSDFVVTDRRRPILMVACKAADAPLDRSLRYLKTRFPDCPAWQLSAQGTRDYQTPEGIRVAPGLELLGQLV